MTTGDANGNSNVKVNIDEATVVSFGNEWSRFDQSELPETERADIFERYFGIFPWGELSKDAEGFDMGCGSGRWAMLVAPRALIVEACAA